MLEITSQITQDEQERIELIVATAKVVIVTLSIWMILLFCLVGKTITKIWILNNAVQFIVYIGLWKVNYPDEIKAFFTELKRITLFEFFDSLSVACRMGKEMKMLSDSKDCDE